jgi:hypothetical protein
MRKHRRGMNLGGTRFHDPPGVDTEDTTRNGDRQRLALPILDRCGERVPRRADMYRLRRMTMSYIALERYPDRMVSRTIFFAVPSAPALTPL